MTARSEPTKGPWTGADLPPFRLDRDENPEYDPYPFHLMTRMKLPDGRFVMVSMALVDSQESGDQILRALAAPDMAKEITALQAEVGRLRFELDAYKKWHANHVCQGKRERWSAEAIKARALSRPEGKGGG